MLKRSDYIILGLICFILGFVIISQYFASINVKKLLQPENNDVMALEIEKVAKSNAFLNGEVARLTKNYDDYKNSLGNSATSRQKMQEEISSLNAINGVTQLSGQGVVITAVGDLSTANLIDLVNALKNIGAEAISINNQRILINSYISSQNYSSPLSIISLGNSSVLESALNRRGGIIEQISSKSVKINVEKNDSVTIPAGDELKYDFAEIVN